jgi:hypothetical protein
MSFQAYRDNVEARTGKSADALKAVAIEKGLADESGLAHRREGPARSSTG